nr:MAG TPA: hypothetical protein [Caudoviricetes sp.]
MPCYASPITIQGVLRKAVILYEKSRGFNW